MYISKKEHIISRAICGTAIIRLAGEALNLIVRQILNKSQLLAPDMFNSTLGVFGNVVTVVQLILICGIFYASYRRICHIRALLPKDDYIEIAKLQEDVAGDKISTLSSYSIVQLLQVWAAILIGIQILYDVTSKSYQDFILQMYALIDFSDENIANAFVSVYNNSHGFKYIGMYVAIALGIFVTGIFLRDSFLKISAFIILALFIISFEILQMNTIFFMDRSIGIVWTSVIYHLIQTIGLFGFSLYLGIRYEGL